MKTKFKIVLISAHLVFAAYLLMYCLSSGYLVPLLNNEIFRTIVLVGLSSFALVSLILVLLPNQNSFLYKSLLWFYTIFLLIPNILIPVLGPAIWAMNPFKQS